MDLVKVKTLIPAPDDGLSAPEYTELRYALSNTASTADETTAPAISGSWTAGTPFPNNTYPYVWMRSRYYVRVGLEWTLRSTTYTRLTGESGTSVTIVGETLGVYASSDDFPSPVEGKCALVRDDGHTYGVRHHGNTLQWSRNPSESAVGEALVCSSDGHLYSWTGEVWQDCGVFRGESGASAYVHVAWAVTLDQTTSGGKAYPSDFDLEKNASKSYNFIGVLSDNTAMDSADGSLYEWSDIRGKDAVVYYITTTVASIAANADGVPVNPNESIVVRQWKKVGNSAAVQSADMILRTYTVLNGVKAYFGQFDWGSVASFLAVAAEGKDSILAELIDSNSYVVYSLSIPVVKQGVTGQKGSMGRFPYYDGEYVSTRDYAFNSFSVPYITVTDENTGQTVKWIRRQTEAQEGVACIGIKPGVTQGYANYWEIMTSSFKYLVAEMVFAAFAKMANWIFNGNLMFSEQGVGQGGYQNINNGWNPNVLLNSLTGYAHFGADKIRFNPDGSGWLADHNIAWDLLGNLNIAGLVRKKKTVITNANRDDFMTVVGTDVDNEGNQVNVYALDVLKAGNWIVLDGVQPGLYIKLPSMRYDGSYSEDEKDLARSLVGCSIIVNSVNHTYLCGFRQTHMEFYAPFDLHGNRLSYEDGGSNEGNIGFSNLDTVYLECVLADVKDSNGWYREDIKWIARDVRK